MPPRNPNATAATNSYAAAGLAAAVPAVIGYNYFINKIKVIDSEMEDFSLEFLSIAERNFT